MLYEAIRTVVGNATRVAYRLRVSGEERLPETGGFVIAPSHRSMMDIPFVGWVVPEPIGYMGKRSLFDLPVLGRAFSSLGGIPVERDGNDRKALRTALERLAEGQPMLIFPEGTRDHGAVIDDLQPGAAYLALRAGVPLVPMGIAGTEEIVRSQRFPVPRFHRVAVVIGEPLFPPVLGGTVVPRAEVDALTGRLAVALQQAFDQAYRLRDAGPPPSA